MKELIGRWKDWLKRHLQNYHNDPKSPGDSPHVDPTDLHADEPALKIVDRGKGDIEGSRPEEELRRRSRHFLALQRRDERHYGSDESVGARVVAVIWQKVVVELPKGVQRDATVRDADVVIRFSEESVEGGQLKGEDARVIFFI